MAQVPLRGSSVAQQHTIALGDIISSYELGLVIIAGGHEHALDTPVQWVHSTDLFDPTPFLTPRTVLLTTGSQFEQDLSPERASEYVQRLKEAGVSGLGFAVEIIHDRIPVALIDACQKQDLPLFRVPYDTPFIAITQSATRMLSAKSFERERWSLDTQRAVSRAALRRLGLPAAVDELADRLGRWVTLSNAQGTLIHASPGAIREGATAAWIQETVEETGRRGIPQNLNRQHAGQRVHLQTIAGGSGIQGVITVASTTPLDHAEHSAIEQVATLAALNFEQHRQLSSGRSQLKSAVLTLLLAKHTDVALEVSQAFEHHLPEDQLLLMFMGDAGGMRAGRFEQLQAVASQLEEVLLGSHEGNLILLTPPRHRARLIGVCESLSLPTGVSRKHRLGDIDEALTEAQSAYRVALAKRSDGAVAEFEAAMSEGVTSLLEEHPEATSRALRILDPLLEYDRAHAGELMETLTSWLTHHGQMSPTADALGVHRHTVSSRMKLIGALTGRHLQDPMDRAELLLSVSLVTGR